MEHERLIEASGINKTFPGVKALSNVCFNLEAGEVHVLLGENGAGKSTFIKTLSGANTIDSGTIMIQGKEVTIGNVNKAQDLGIATIYQELNLIPELTIAQNIFLNREIKKAGIVVDRETTRKESLRLLEPLGLNIDPDTPIKELSVAQQQLVEVAKALSLNAKIIIFDEPTGTLAQKAVDNLFDVIRELKKQNIGIIYISHRLEEIWEIGDRVTVLRDGQYIDTVKVEDTSIPSLINMMVGRELKAVFTRNIQEPGGTVLDVKDITRAPLLKNININIKKGEIVGLAGLVGAGRTELARILFGVDKADYGEIYLNGSKVEISSPTKAVSKGIGFITEDRKTLGLFQELTVKENITHAAMNKLFPNKIINTEVELKEVNKQINDLSIKTPGVNQQVKNLSGGNQQKVVLGKWLATDAQLFIFDEPTRGIDVGAKQEIYKLMDQLVQKGFPILMISSELPEIIGMSDRIYVMRNGRITAEYSRENVTQEKILESAIGGNEE